MAGTLWGADVEQLRTLAQQFSKTADLLQQQSTQLSSQINNNPAWKGADAQRFRSDWNGNQREDPKGQTLYVKNGDDQTWTIGISTPERADITETRGVDDAGLLNHIRTIRQD